MSSNAKLQSFSAANMMVPTEGPKVVPLIMGLAIAQTVAVDFTNAQALGQISFIQGVFIDNSLNTAKTTVLCGITNQCVTCPPNSQGYFPLFSPTPPKMTVTSAGNVNVPMFFYNVPMPAVVWSTLSGGGQNTYSGAGYLQVSDVALDALIADIGSGSGLKVNVLNSSGGSLVYPADSFVPPNTITGVSAFGEYWDTQNNYWNRARGNDYGSLRGMSAFSGAAGFTTAFNNYCQSAIMLQISVTALTAAATLTIQHMALNQSDSAYQLINTAKIDITAIGDYAFHYGLGLPNVANVSAAGVVGRIQRQQYSITAAASATFSLAYHLSH